MRKAVRWTALLATGAVMQLAGCGDTCTSGNVLLTLQYDSASAPADRVDVSVNVDGRIEMLSRPRTQGTTDTLPITFDKGYPLGKTFSVEARAYRNGSLLGGGIAGPTTLAAGCTNLTVAIAAGYLPDAGSDDALLQAPVDGGLDLTTVDLPMTDLSISDLATSDLPLADLLAYDLSLPDLSSPTATPDLATPDLQTQDGPVLPAPTLSGVLPTSGPSLTPTMVTLTGTGFVAGAAVAFDGKPATQVKVTSSTTMTALTPMDPGKQGKVDVVVTNPDGQTAIGKALFSYYSSQLDFFAARIFATGAKPSAIASGNLNASNNFRDLVVANQADNTIEVLLGKGTGWFQDPVLYDPKVTAPVAVLVVDLNTSSEDVVTVGTNGVSILYGIGNGTLNKTPTILTAGRLPSAVIAGGFHNANKDYLDLVVANSMDNTVGIYTSKGTGSFSAPILFGSGGPYPQFIAPAVDVDGDGSLDLVVANADVNGVMGSVGVLIGNGEGAFQDAIHVAAGPNPVAVVVADFNRDGMLDLAVLNGTTGAVYLVPGNGNRTFKPFLKPTTPVDSNPRQLVVADFNGDSKSDLAVVNTGSSDVSVLLGNGDGTFQSATNLSAGYEPYSMVVDDWNRDGVKDLALTNYQKDRGESSGRVLLGVGNGTFKVAPAVASGGQQTQGIVTADFNGDGHPDLAVSNYSSNSVSALLGKGDGTFLPFKTTAVTSNRAAVLAVGDWDGNGKTDLAFADTVSDKVIPLSGNGDGTFMQLATVGVGRNPIALAAGDLNGDGMLDLVVVNSLGNSLTILKGDGKGGFTVVAGTPTQIMQAPIAVPYSAAIGDLDGTGVKNDIAVVLEGTGEVGVLLNPNPQGFQYPNSYRYFVGSAPSFVAIADFTHDSKNDLAVALRSAVVVLPGKGDGTFDLMNTTNSPGHGGSTTLVVGDWNGDSNHDIVVVTGVTTRDVVVLLGNGNGTFQPLLSWGGGAGSDTAVAGDWNGDGLLDLATSNYGSNDVSILRNISQ